MTSVLPDTTRFDQPVLSGTGLAPMYSAKQTIGFAELSAAALTATVAITGIPANSRIVGSNHHVGTPFVGAGITSLGGELGDAVDPDELALSFDMLVAGGSQGSLGDGVLVPFSFEAAYAPLLLATAVGANLDQLTAGSVDVEIYYFNPNLVES